jgi:hypothetical protein
MPHSKAYKGVIWTNHALKRLKDRKFSQHLAWKTIIFPDKKQRGKNNGSYEFTKNFGHRTVTVVANKTRENEWLVVSTWIDPPLKGSIDLKKQKRSVFSWIFDSLIKKLSRILKISV